MSRRATPEEVARHKIREALSAAALNLEASQRERDQLIVEARRFGLPVREIAELAEVSPQTVLNIVARHEDNA